MATYYGSSEHGLDDKGRLILPSRILDEVPKSQWKFHLTAGLDRCLLLHDSEGFKELVDRIGRAVPGSRGHRALCRRFLGHSEEVVPDGNRRIRIPEPLLKYAGIAPSQSVTLVGPAGSSRSGRRQTSARHWSRRRPRKSCSLQV
jgi:MraZ protein